MVATAGLLAAAVVGAVLQLRHDGHGQASAGPKAAATPTGPAARHPSASPAVRPSSPPASPATSPKRTPAPGAGGVTTVAVSPTIAGNPATTQVKNFLDRYFTAINEHNFQAYTSLLGQQTSASAFASGYGSTTDTDAVLVGISADQTTGMLAASVTFTSHQRPADSPDGSPCDDWTITLYLTPHAGSYMLASPPSTYTPSHHACQ
jgi:hypothetical protein